MLKKMNDCVDCGLPCVGGFCTKADALSVCCDRCGCRAELFYLLDGEELCRDCFIDTALENAQTKSAEALMDF